VAEHRIAVIAFHMFVESDAWASLGHDRDERGLADFEWVTAQVVAVQLNQVEGVEEDRPVVAAVADTVELGDAGLVASDRLAVDDAGLGSEPAPAFSTMSSTMSNGQSGLCQIESHAGPLAGNDAGSRHP